MTEADWLACTNPERMVRFLNDKASDRKLRLFACNCARQVWDLLAGRLGREAVAASERYADGLAEEADLDAARRALTDWLNASYFSWRSSINSNEQLLALRAALATCHANTFRAALEAAKQIAQAAVNRCPPQVIVNKAARRRAAEAARGQQHRDTCRLLREMIGNPFWPVAIPPSWLAWHEGLIPSMARRMYDERHFAELPVLADALEDAGCEDADILDHCRGGGPHVRGCWVLDALLGKP
jgi:hypothetical protein